MLSVRTSCLRANRSLAALAPAPGRSFSSLLVGAQQQQQRSRGRCRLAGISQTSFSLPRMQREEQTMLRQCARSMATGEETRIEMLRNIGISAHIDSGKTTLTERILFYCGKIRAIHDVKGKDDHGAKMDHMELEKEKGITITSAATFTHWKGAHVNIIDTPGHVDFTIEVERALRVLDGAIMVLCGVAGVQSQSMTVDRQMKRYDVPRVCFINKLDRMGANPNKVIEGLRTVLRLNCAKVQLPIGLEHLHVGCVDVIRMKSYTYGGDFGDVVIEGEVPADMVEEANAARHELIELVAEVDDELAEAFLEHEYEVPEADLKAAIRRATIALKFVPVFMGSAFKNKGVQPLLDGVVDYLPDPTQVTNVALNQAKNEEPTTLQIDPKKPFVGLAFKLQATQFGQITYMRIYQGTLSKGKVIYNTATNKKQKVPRLIRMHSAEMEDVTSLGPGEIGALFGVECESGTTFTESNQHLLTMTSMHVPEPVISLALRPKDPSQISGKGGFSKGLARFIKEDPTFRVSYDAESKETIISGMGELHLEVYKERLHREYNVECITGNPQVNYRETIMNHAEFEYTHKKQTGGAGQYAKISGSVEPMPEGQEKENLFVNGLRGSNVPPEYISAIEKGFYAACNEGVGLGAPVQGVKMTIVDGQAHAVDSSELAFRIATMAAFKQGCRNAGVQIKEPIMKVEAECPEEFQGAVTAGLNKRRAMINDVNTIGGYTTVNCSVPLKAMFGYSTDLRSATEGKGEYSMEYEYHAPVSNMEQQELIDAHAKKVSSKEE